jgi:hypothetical protein
VGEDDEWSDIVEYRFLLESLRVYDPNSIFSSLCIWPDKKKKNVTFMLKALITIESTLEIKLLNTGTTLIYHQYKTF